MLNLFENSNSRGRAWPLLRPLAMSYIRRIIGSGGGWPCSSIVGRVCCLLFCFLSFCCVTSLPNSPFCAALESGQRFFSTWRIHRERESRNVMGVVSHWPASRYTHTHCKCVHRFSLFLFLLIRLILSPLCSCVAFHLCIFACIYSCVFLRIILSRTHMKEKWK